MKSEGELWVPETRQLIEVHSFEHCERPRYSDAIKVFLVSNAALGSLEMDQSPEDHEYPPPTLVGSRT